MKKSKIIQVAQLGQPIRRVKAKMVRNILDPEVQETIGDLLATCADFDGVGIAAPQIDQSLRIVVVASHPSPRYPKAPNMKPTPMINPRITRRSAAKKKDWEGCLSVPGLRALVSRSIWIKIEYMDRAGKLHRSRFKDFVARIIQHEIDHLDGVLFVDRTRGRDMVTEKEYQRIMKKAL